MLRLVTCVIAACDDCGTDPEDDDVDGIPHWNDTNAAEQWLTAPASGWHVAAGGLLTCPNCVAKRDCAIYGHDWQPWGRCRCGGRIRDHHTDTGGTCTHETRWCQRCPEADRRLGEHAVTTTQH